MKNNEVVYDKTKMNGRSQVGSGRIVTFTHDTPFTENIILHSNNEINDKTVNNDYLKNFDRDDGVSIFHLIDEKEKLLIENAAIKAGIKRLKECLQARSTKSRPQIKYANGLVF